MALRPRPIALLACVAVCGAAGYWALRGSPQGVGRMERWTTHLVSKTPPPAVTWDSLRDGDIVFHKSRSAQSEAIGLATRSRYTHMGIVYLSAAGPVVFEAVEPVKTTPIAAWVARGEDGHVVVKRLKQRAALTPAALAKMKQVGRGFLGRHYDTTFRWNDRELYCSELVYKIYERGAGIRIGELTRIRDLDLSHPVVAAKLRQRRGLDLNESVITPQAMFDSELLETVYEN